MKERDKLALFERTVTPHAGAAYNLARWLMRNDQDAEDVVQEASIRAFRSLESYHGGDSRAWLLAIVRNTSYTHLQRKRGHDFTVALDETVQDIPSDTPGPETLLLRRADRETLRQAIDGLPAEYREMIVLRDMEDLSYKEIAAIANVPIGTVMSRLARARRRLQTSLTDRMEKEVQHEL